MTDQQKNEIDEKFIGFITELDKPKEIINSFGTRDGEKRTQHPGRVICTIVSDDQRYNNERIKKIFSSTEQNDNSISNCKHKLYAASYHLDTIMKEFNEVFEKYKKGGLPTGAGANYEYRNYILIYETESFLFQIKSNLDLIIFFLSKYIKCLKPFRSFKHSGENGVFKAGGSILKELENKKITKRYNFFEQERIDWIQNLVIMRDEITHYSKLKGFVNFVEDPNTEEKYSIIYFPKMPNGKRLDIYCKNVFDKLCNMYENVFTILENQPID